MSGEADTGSAVARKPCIACREWIARDATVCPYCRTPQSAPPRRRFSPLLKWVGGITAAVSLVLALSQVQGLVRSWREKRAEVSRLVGAGDLQLARRDYPAAFASYGSALKIDPGSRRAQEKEEQAAMRWLENMAIHEGQTFTDAVNPILPVLDRGLETAQGQRAADLLAHEGWANFLKEREGGGDEVAVDQALHRSLAADPANVYAHAMSGFWILWQHGSIDDARPHFVAALGSGRARSYVRELEVAALLNLESDPAGEELLRVANDMRRENEVLDPDQRHRITTVYWEAAYDRARLVHLLEVLGPDDRLATFRWLDAGNDLDPITRDFVAANLLELAADGSGALRAYQSLRAEIKARRSGSPYLPDIEAALRRLNHHP